MTCLIRVELSVCPSVRPFVLQCWTGLDEGMECGVVGLNL